MTTIAAFDVDSVNKPISFAKAAAQGYRTCYIKLGGDNINGASPYVMSSNGGYVGQMSQAVAAGFTRRGSYWVTGRSDPAGSARFYLANRHKATTFDVLDNEQLNDGRAWSPAECYAFFKVLHDAGLRDLWMYASRLGPWAQDDYTGLAKLGVKAIVADYGTAQLGSKIFTINYPRDLIRGHQWTSSAAVGGLANVDGDVFTDNAFTAAQSATPERVRKVAISTAEAYAWKPAFMWWSGGVKHLATTAQKQSALYLERLTVENYSNAAEFQNTIYNYGLEEYTVQDIIELSITRNPDGSVKNYNRGGLLIASWADVRKVGTAAVDSDAIAAALAGKLTIPTHFTITGEAAA